MPRLDTHDLSRLPVRPVRGRPSPTYRTHDPGDATASREAPLPRQWKQITSVIAEVPGVVMDIEGRDLELRFQGDESRFVLRAPDEDPVELASLELFGNERLGIRAVHALVDLFGPMEITIGEYVDVIDGKEPAEVVDERHREDLHKRATAMLDAWKEYDAKTGSLFHQVQGVLDARRRTEAEAQPTRMIVAFAMVVIGCFLLLLLSR